jgi:membrane-associated phospholipid phosphatase
VTLPLWTRSLDEEIKELIGLIEYRPFMLQEGIEQAGMFDAYFSAVLTFNRFSHPATAKIYSIAFEAATHLVQTYKLAYNRPRPSQICPTLAPPIDPPEHASYPSGHATQAWLVAFMLDEVIRPGGGGAGYLTPDPAKLPLAPGSPPRRNPLFDMAQRIARNREVMGLHYPSDSEAGRRLAWAGAKVLLAMPAVTMDVRGPVDHQNPGAPVPTQTRTLVDLPALIAEAQSEWG